MSRRYKFYTVKFFEEEHKKPRWFYSPDELEIGDSVECICGKNGRMDKGYVCGVFETTRSTMKQIVEQCGGYFPLAPCVKYETNKTENKKDIFVMMGICKDGESTIDMFEKMCDELNLDKSSKRKTILEQLNEVYGKPYKEEK